MNDLTLNIVLIYLVVINGVTFVVYGIDKYKAVRSKWRIPESTLIGLAVVGGSIGAWLGMKFWHHKTLTRSSGLAFPSSSLPRSPSLGG